MEARTDAPKPPITLSLQDIAAANRRVSETPRQKEVKEVASKARTIALDKLGTANSLQDYMIYHRAAKFAQPHLIEWAWDYGGTTAEEIIEDDESERFQAVTRKDVKAAEAMREQLGNIEPKEGMVRVAIKRVRDEGGYITYRALAAFPKGEAVQDPVLGTTPADPEEEQVVFFEPQNACVIHNMDDLYKAHRETGTFYIPHRTHGEALKGLQTNPNSITEYMLERTEDGKITQDPENYIFFTLIGGFSNEDGRIRVSDFWNKNK